MIALTAMFLALHTFASEVRELSLKPKDIGTIRTALGYSTVIQLASKPINVVLGDQSSFRIEFIKDSITIKPLRPGARSNLFIFTDRDRFNLTLKSVSSENVDYVVKLKRIFEDSKVSKNINKHVTIKDIKLTLTRHTNAEHNSFIDFEISNLSTSAITLQPENFRFRTKELPLNIEDLYLESLSIKPKQAINGSFKIAKAFELFPSSIWLCLKGQKPMKFSFLSISKGVAGEIKRMD